MDLAVDPVQPRHLFVALRGRTGGIYESIDGGDFWFIRSRYPALRLLVDPDGSTLYASDLSASVVRRMFR